MKKLADLPFIVRLSYTFQTENELYFAMEPCIGGTLFHFITHSAKGDLNINIIKFYCAEIIIALEKIHSKNIMYRDLKPENVLIDIDGHIKLSDFGLSKQIKKREETSMTFCGSPEYLPPEMILGKEHSRAVDFYTLGCLVYEMIVGFPPFHTENTKNLERRIVSGIIKFPYGIDENAKDLIEWLLTKNPEERPQEFSQIKMHPFFNDIHWGRFSKKESIPPWGKGIEIYVTDLYSCHVSKRQSSIPLSHAFFNNPLLKESSRKSYNLKANSNTLKDRIHTSDQNSNSELRKITGKLSETLEEILNIDGFDSINESYEEIRIKTQIDSYFIKKKQSNLSIKGKSSRTKYSDNPFVSEDPDDSECNCSIDSEGGANSTHMYFIPRNAISKHKSFTAKEPIKLDCKPVKRSNQKLKLCKQDFEKINENCSSRNGCDSYPDEI